MDGWVHAVASRHCQPLPVVVSSHETTTAAADELPPLFCERNYVRCRRYRYHRPNGIIWFGLSAAILLTLYGGGGLLVQTYASLTTDSVNKPSGHPPAPEAFGDASASSYQSPQSSQPELVPLLSANNFTRYVDRRPNSGWSSLTGLGKVQVSFAVLFFGSAAECYACSSAISEFKSAATRIQDEPPNRERQNDEDLKPTTLQFAMVNGDDEHDIVDEQDIYHFPTLKLFFHGGESAEYDGEYKADKIAEWMRRLSDKPFTVLKTVEELASFTESDNRSMVAAVGFLDPSEENEDASTSGAMHSKQLRSFISLARSIKDSDVKSIKFGVVRSREIATELLISLEQLPTLLIFRPVGFGPEGEDEVVQYFGEISDSRAMRHFVDKFRFPTVTRLTDENPQELFGEASRSVALLVIDEELSSSSTTRLSSKNIWIVEESSDAEGSTNALNKTNRLNSQIKKAFLEAARDFDRDGPVLFIVSGTNAPVEIQLLEQLGASGGIVEISSIWQIDIRKGRVMAKHKMDIAAVIRKNRMSVDSSTTAGDTARPRDSAENGALITGQNVIDFLEASVKGEAIPFIKSQPIPATQPGPVYQLVGHTFEQLVVKTAKNLLVMFYAPWCGHSKRLEPVFREAALRLADESEILFAKIDVTSNDVPIDIEGFPTLIFFPIVGKYQPVVYDGERTVQAIIDFVLIVSSADLAEITSEDVGSPDTSMPTRVGRTRVGRTRGHPSRGGKGNSGGDRGKAESDTHGDEELIDDEEMDDDDDDEEDGGVEDYYYEEDEDDVYDDEYRDEL